MVGHNDPDGDESAAVGSWEAYAQQVWQDASDRLGALFQKTQNPLYAWEMIWIAHVTSRTKSMGTPEFLAIEVKPMQLPDWCLQYLFSAACGMRTLKDQIDWSARPDFDNIDDDMKWRRKNKIDSQKLVKLVPEALGFLASGTTAFRDFNSRKSRIRDHEYYTDLIEKGFTKAEAVRLLMEIWGIGDEQSVYRRLGKAIREVEDDDNNQD